MRRPFPFWAFVLWWAIKAITIPVWVPIMLVIVLLFRIVDITISWWNDMKYRSGEYVRSKQ